MTDTPEDPASAVINTFITAMRAAFNPDDAVQAPLGGGSTDVRFFAGDGALPAWNPSPGKCVPPFLWVRADRRYRSKLKEFPAAFVGSLPCGAVDVVRVLAVEVGVARCSTLEVTPRWDVLAKEAEVGLDDSWRIELALCRASAELSVGKRAVATDTVAPIGPEGGITAWTGMAYVQF